MKQVALFFIFINLFFDARTQDLIPFLGKSGKYGYATAEGRLIVAPAFEKAEIMPANRFYTVINRNSPCLYLLRNGQTLTFDNPSTIIVGACNYDHQGEKKDSLPQIAVALDGDRIVLYNFKNNAQVSAKNLTRNNATNWFSNYFHKKPLGSFQPARFQEGYYPIWKNANAMNFVDINLKTIFPRDFAAGAVLDADHFLLADTAYHYAIGDRNGKVRTPFVWTSIRPTLKTGRFIVTGPYYNHGKAGITGVIDADGKIIVDTIFRNIEPFGRFLVVENRIGFGLLDYDGKTIIPIDAKGMYIVGEGRFLLVLKEEKVNGQHAQLLDREGRNLTPPNARRITPMTGKSFPHFLIETNDEQIFVDTAMREVARFKGFFRGEISETDPFVFNMTKSDQGRDQSALYNREGLILTEKTFDEIIRVFPHRYRVKTNDLYGVVSGRGKTIVPCEFTQIKEQIIPGDTIFWGKTTEERWFAFDRNGQKRSESGRFTASVFSDPAIGVVKTPGNRQVTAFLPDGSRLTPPDSLFNEWHLLHSLHTPAGGLLVFARFDRGQTEVLYRKENFEPLIPPRFIPVRAMQQTGLVAVRRLKNNQNYSQLIPTTEQDVNGLFESCGVLNAAGEWVLTPKSGVIYRPVSDYMVLELPEGTDFIGGKGNFSNKILRVHRVNQPPKPAVEVDYVHDNFFQSGKKTIRMARKNAAARDRILFAYFDEKGSQLTPFGVWSGPDYLQSRNLVTMVNPRKPDEQTQLIINEKGETLYDLGHLVCENPPMSNDPNWYLDYFVVNERMTASEVKNYDAMTNRQQVEFKQNRRVKQGIMDTFGRLVQPLQYYNLYIVKPDMFFAASDSTGLVSLFDWSGDTLYRFDPKPGKVYFHGQPVSVLSLEGDRLIVSDGASSVLLDESDRRVIRVFKMPHSGASDPLRRYFTLITPEGNALWVRAKDGKTYQTD